MLRRLGMLNLPECTAMDLACMYTIPQSREPRPAKNHVIENRGGAILFLPGVPFMPLYSERLEREGSKGT